MKKLTSLLMIITLVMSSLSSLEIVKDNNTISLASEERDSESDGVVLFSLEETQEY